jgi:hypothetical protein
MVMSNNALRIIGTEIKRKVLHDIVLPPLAEKLPNKLLFKLFD